MASFANGQQKGQISLSAAKKIYFHLDNFIKIAQNISVVYRCVAQFGRALRSGRRGRRFKSCHTDRLPQTVWFAAFFYFLKPPDSKAWTGVFFYILFFIAAYIKEDKGFPVHQNRFFYKQKIPYVHKSQWLGGFAH